MYYSALMPFFCMITRRFSFDEEQRKREREEIARRVPKETPSADRIAKAEARRKLLKEQLRALLEKEEKGDGKRR